MYSAERNVLTRCELGMGRRGGEGRWAKKERRWESSREEKIMNGERRSDAVIMKWGFAWAGGSQCSALMSMQWGQSIFNEMSSWVQHPNPRGKLHWKGWVWEWGREGGREGENWMAEKKGGFAVSTTTERSGQHLMREGDGATGEGERKKKMGGKWRLSEMKGRRGRRCNERGMREIG